MDEKLNEKISEVYIHTWDGLYELYNKNFRINNFRMNHSPNISEDIYKKVSNVEESQSLWIFRGQEKDLPLETLLRRHLIGFQINRERYREKELGLIRKFQREYQHYNQFIPEKNDLVQWLSIMQHYGCPTRLLDFSYSFFNSIWMAVENIQGFKEENTDFNKNCPDGCKECPGPAVIWAIESRWLDKRVKYCSPSRNRIIHQLEKKTPTDISNYTIFNNLTLGTYPVNPFELNDRLRVQQGLFLIPFSITHSFEDNLYEIIRTCKEEDDIKQNIIKIYLCNKSDFIIDCLRELKRMGITTASIYPGLAGYAKSLRNLIPLEDEFLSDGE